MAGISAVTMLMKGSEFQWQTDTWIWQDDAACAFTGAGLFEYQATEGRNKNEVRQALALEICASCPVRQECLDASDIDDRRWTIRGGQPFGVLLSANEGRELVARGVKCPEGHDEWFMRADTSSYRCKPCHSEAVNKAKVKKRAEIRAAKGQPGSGSVTKIDVTKPCKVCGEIAWIQWGKVNPANRCKTCSNRKRRERRAQGGSLSS